MTIETAATLSGLLFWLIIITNIASNRFGYQTFGDIEKEAELSRINDNPREFKIGFILIFVEHIFIILLAVMLFIAFGQNSLILGLVWLASRTAEGLMQILNKRNYWKLLDVAKQFSGASDAEKVNLADSRLRILRSKYNNFILSQLLFALGTLAYSIVFVTYGVVPVAIGWFGVAAAILYGLGNMITLLKPDFKVFWSLGGLLILIFEAILGGWLLFS